MMKKYNLLNNVIGWMVFAVAAATYLLTIEPTASFWDCPEFISQGFKLEVGHPPGNPIFMLVARFAINFAGSLETVSVAVNSMSAILSALTILLLFWTITHLVRRLVLDGEAGEPALRHYLVIFGSGIAGALAYTWSDTFWFSAVEAEVYAFSSFCTALVFWLILKWEDRADEPNSDRWLVLIAYVIGVSVAVHLLNLLCIPAIVLVFYYKKWEQTSVKGSLVALLVSFAIIALILFGLVPGFIKAAQIFELLCVNTLGLPFNTGAVLYAVICFAVFGWCIAELYRQQSAARMKWSFFAAVVLSGMLFIGDGWLLAVVLVAALAVYLKRFCRRVPVRQFSLVALSMLVIFIGYSSYALILIRSNSHTPVNQNSPDNVFSLASYLNREQYGDTPLLYGKTFNASIVYQDNGQGGYSPVTKDGKKLYSREVKESAGQKDHYYLKGVDKKYQTNPELDMLFPRMYSGAHARQYQEWIGMTGEMKQATTRLDSKGNVIATEPKLKPTFTENLQFFVDYQLNYMYWRYFMWNFAGRQNDIQGMGEITQGNWISGIPVIDNMRLGDQSLLPDDLAGGNKGHNVFYMLPLLLGIIGLVWQAYAGKRGIEQFWVVFFLFFMTGIAIVLYLNQTPSQPRERDYAYAGSFYAYAIWIGMGVAGLWRGVLALMARARQKRGAAAGTQESERTQTAVALAVAVLGLLVPLQMVSQTWDDHDRSGRFPARDFGMNYLSSLDKNAIIFTNGDNDTFPLWYCQEVEGYRTDVRVINLSYLTTDWYIDQMRYPTYQSAPVPMMADRTTFAYDRRQYNYFVEPDSTPVPVRKSLEQLYGPGYQHNAWNLPEMKYPVMYIPVDAEAAVRAGVVSEKHRDAIQEAIVVDLLTDRYTSRDAALSCSGVMTLDILNSSVEQGWKRPVYFAMTVPDEYYVGLKPYMQNTGMAFQVTPIRQLDSDGEITCNSDKMYRNIMTKFRWAGIDKAPAGSLYLDETIRRMVSTTRSAMLDLAAMLIYEGADAQQRATATDPAQRANTTPDALNAYAKQRFAMARNVMRTMVKKLPPKASPYTVQMGFQLAQNWDYLAHCTKLKADADQAFSVLAEEVRHYAQFARFYQSLDVSLYNRLANTDRYIDQRYLPNLLYYLSTLDEAKAHKVVDELILAGVNVDRSINFLQAADEQQARQEQAQAQAAAADTTAQ